MKKLSLTKLGEKNNQFTSSTAPTANEFGIGDLWIDGAHYYSNGFSTREVQSTKNNRPRADRATCDTYLNFAELSPEVCTSANATNPTVTADPDLSGVTCSADAFPTAANFGGLRVTNTAGFWDFSGQYTYPGQSADTVFLLDVEFPEMPNGNNMQFSTSLTIYFVTGADGSSGYVNNRRILSRLNRVNKGRRELIGFRESDLASTGAPNLAEVKRIEIRMINELKTVEPLSIKIRGLYVNVKRKGRVILSFDNAHTSWYQNVFKKHIQPKGWGCAQAFVSERVGNSGVMTVEMLREAQLSGCELINHTSDHDTPFKLVTPTISGNGPWTINYYEVAHGRSTGDVIFASGQSKTLVNGTKTITVVDANNFTATETVNPDGDTFIFGNCNIKNNLWSDRNITDCSQYFSDNGLVESSVYIYPGGFYEPDTWDQLKRLGFISARGVAGGAEPANASNVHYGPISEYIIPTIELSTPQTAADILARMDKILAHGADCHTYGHSVVESPSLSTEFATSEFDALVVGIQARIDSGLCDVPMRCDEAVYNY